MSAGVFSNPIVPGVVFGGFGVVTQGNLALTEAAPEGGLVVELQGSTPALGVPASVTVPAGAKAFQYPITVGLVPVNTVAMVVASANGTNAIGFGYILSSSVQPSGPVPAGMTFGNGYGKGGTVVTGYLTLTHPAPAGGLTVPLSSNNPELAGSDGFAAFEAGSNLAAFHVGLTVPSVDTPVLITATLNGVSQSAFLIVQH